MELGKMGGRPAKKKTNRGQPKSRKSVNSLLKHIQKTAPTPLSEQSELALIQDTPTSSKVICGVCHGLIHQPLELACTHYACAKCLYTTVHRTQGG